MKSVFAVVIAIISLPLSASSIPLTQAIELCRAEQNALRRLTCYDNIQNTPAQLNNSAAQTLPVQAAPAAQAANKAEPADIFGMEHKQTSDENASDKIYVKVTKIQFSPRKELIVTFDNRQVWRQNGTDYYKIEVGEQHFIKRGALNSFFLGNENNNRIIRVRREK